MESIEQNDVDISKLFGWKSEFITKDMNGADIFKVYIRIIGDADINIARTAAIRESGKLRAQIKSNKDDIAYAYFLPQELMEREDLIQLLVQLSMRDFSREVIDETKLKLPKEPGSDATLEEQENYQKQVDEYPALRLRMIEEKLTTKLEKFRVELATKSTNELYKLYTKAVIDMACELKMIETFRDMCVYSASYKDSEYKQRLFSSYSEFENLPSEMKDQFREAYLNLELSQENLKKSPEVTP